MRRLLLIPFALIGLATLGLASAGAFSAIHQANASAAGTIERLGKSSITVGAHDRGHLTCSITAYSPSTGTFGVGDRVRIACASRVLVAIADVRLHTEKRTDHHSSSGDDAGKATTSSGPTITSANGPITALGTGSISVQTMTCTIGPGSPSTAGFAVGNSVRMYCENGVLFQLRHNDDTPPPPPPTTATTTTQQNITGITGTIAALTGSAITVHSAGGTDAPNSLTCTIGPGSASTSGFSIGDSVRMYCLSGALYQLRRNDSTPPSPTTTSTTTTTTTTQQNYTGITGAIATLTGSSISVNGAGDSDGPASLTCTIGPGSPSTSGFSAGNSVRMYCLNGSLYQLRRNDSTLPPTTSTTTTTTTQQSPTGRAGAITALSADSITVSSGDGSLTCTIVQSSPRTSGFAIGNPVQLTCLNGALSTLTHKV